MKTWSCYCSKDKQETTTMFPFFFLVICLCRESSAFITGSLISGRVCLSIRQTNGASIRSADYMLPAKSGLRTLRSIPDILSMQAASTTSTELRRSCKVAILGGGFGGLYTALNLARLATLPGQNFGKLEITLIDSSDR